MCDNGGRHPGDGGPLEAPIVILLKDHVGKCKNCKPCFRCTLTIRHKLGAEFVREESWMIDRSLLKHEQGHFILGIMVARRKQTPFRIVIYACWSEQDITLWMKEYQKKIDEAVKTQAEFDLEMEGHIYDRQTESGTNQRQQDRWNETFQDIRNYDSRD